MWDMQTTRRVGFLCDARERGCPGVGRPDQDSFDQRAGVRNLVQASGIAWTNRRLHRKDRWERRLRRGGGKWQVARFQAIVAVLRVEGIYRDTCGISKCCSKLYPLSWG